MKSYYCVVNMLNLGRITYCHISFIIILYDLNNLCLYCSKYFSHLISLSLNININIDLSHVRFLYPNISDPCLSSMGSISLCDQICYQLSAPDRV